MTPQPEHVQRTSNTALIAPTRPIQMAPMRAILASVQLQRNARFMYVQHSLLPIARLRDGKAFRRQAKQEAITCQKHHQCSLQTRITRQQAEHAPQSVAPDKHPRPWHEQTRFFDSTLCSVKALSSKAAEDDPKISQPRRT